MPGSRTTTETWKKAYRVLDVPEAASALAIKSNYRKLIKRWHPDRPMTGAATASEAMMMTKLINEAYAEIENAPLRYYGGGTAERGNGKPQRKKVASGVESLSEAEAALIEKRAEYGVRIICGVLSGLFVGLIFAEDLFRNETEFFVAALVCAVGFAAGAVIYGDKFWRAVLGKWWMWE